MAIDAADLATSDQDVSGALAQIQLQDGTTIVTDETWKCLDIASADATTLEGWRTPGFDDSLWPFLHPDLPKMDAIRGD